MVECGAYRDEHVAIEPAGSGVLNGLVFAVKDVFDIEGYTSAAGNPDWLRTHGPAARHAPVIRRLLEQGARLQGAAHTDELMYSLNGINHHYGIPVNPKAPGRIPGGSSSGSASAVASSGRDFALGTDTGGSVRIPSSFCGIYGFRPTHGAVSGEGVIPLAPSFDTVGWMTRSVELMQRIGTVLLGGSACGSDSVVGLASCSASESDSALKSNSRSAFELDSVSGSSACSASSSSSGSCSGFRNLYIPWDVWSLAYPETRERLEPCVKKLASVMELSSDIDLSDGGFDPWINAFRVIQGIEIWQTHGEWIRSVRPRFGPGIAERFAWASKLVPEEHEDAFMLRRQVKDRLAELLGEDGVLLIPTAPGPAPLLQSSPDELEVFRNRMLSINCIAGLAGFPQVHLPVEAPDYPPIGISLIAGRGRDRDLLALAERASGEWGINEDN